jgi:hypothetical protein
MGSVKIGYPNFGHYMFTKKSNPSVGQLWSLMPLWIPPIWMVTWCRDLNKTEKKISKCPARWWFTSFTRWFIKLLSQHFCWLVQSCQIHPNPSCVHCEK